MKSKSRALQNKIYLSHIYVWTRKDQKIELYIVFDYDFLIRNWL